MATQQGAPSRPWLRLATMVRPPLPPPPLPAQQPPPPPRPAFIQQTFTQVPPAVQRPPNVVAPTSPPKAKPTPSPTVPKSDPTITRVASSPPPTTISHPPSPLALPSPQLSKPEYEQKGVLMQETKEKPKGLDNLGWGSHKPKGEAFKNSDSDDVKVRIITIAGENKGAIMDLKPFSRKTDHKFAGNIKKDNPTPSSDGDSKSGSNSEGKSKAKNKNQKPKSPLMSAIMNSNVQGVNNSILYNSSTNHHDPGVHLSLSRKPSGGHGF